MRHLGGSHSTRCSGLSNYQYYCRPVFILWQKKRHILPIYLKVVLGMIWLFPEVRGPFRGGPYKMGPTLRDPYQEP